MGVLVDSCNRSDTSGNIHNPGEAIYGINTQQKIKEIKNYHFFINSLFKRIYKPDGVNTELFYFIKKSWIKSWEKYTCYNIIKPLLIEKEINNDIDFHKVIFDHKSEIHFQGFLEKEKPNKVDFFKINYIGTNVQENFYIFDKKIFDFFKNIYGSSLDIENEFFSNLITLEGEIGKGRIVFDVKEYIIIMFINKDKNIKHICVMFQNEEDHKKFLKDISGRALKFISKELNKMKEKFNMVNYQKDGINIFDGRNFIKEEYKNNSLKFSINSNNYLGVSVEGQLFDKKNEKASS